MYIPSTRGSRAVWPSADRYAKSTSPKAEEDEPDEKQQPDPSHGSPAEAEAEADQDHGGHEQDEVEDGVEQVQELLDGGTWAASTGPSRGTATITHTSAVRAPVILRSPGRPVGKPASS